MADSSLPHRLRARLRGALGGAGPKRYPVVLDANRAGGGCERAALLEYLPQAFLLAPDAPERLRHQNLRQCVQIAAVLGELGYLVDVTNKRDRTFRPPRRYDLVVSERADWRGLDELFPDDAVRAFLATAAYHSWHNARVRRRHELLRERRGCDVELRRIYGEHLPAAAAADAIVGFGNEVTLGTWRAIAAGPVLPFDNYGFRETPFADEGKDYERARRRFLHFSSRSQVQKGLDLLLEVFPRHPELELYVCSDFEGEPDFCACYRRELFETPNVHPIGRVMVNGPEYGELVRSCGFVIHPTCSEGQAGSVVQCMHSGLVPLVTREAGIDVEGFGLTFADDGLEAIERLVLGASALPTGELRERAAATRHAAVERFSEDAFVARWRTLIATIVDAGPRRSDRASAPSPLGASDEPDAADPVPAG